MNDASPSPAPTQALGAAISLLTAAMKKHRDYEDQREAQLRSGAAAVAQVAAALEKMTGEQRDAFLQAEIKGLQEQFAALEADYVSKLGAVAQYFEQSIPTTDVAAPATTNGI